MNRTRTGRLAGFLRLFLTNTFHFAWASILIQYQKKNNKNYIILVTAQCLWDMAIKMNSSIDIYSTNVLVAHLKPVVLSILEFIFMALSPGQNNSEQKNHPLKNAHCHNFIHCVLHGLNPLFFHLFIHYIIFLVSDRGSS